MWCNKRSPPADVHTRIDQIWVQQELDYFLIKVEIVDATLITQSDHQIMITLIDSSDLINNHKPSKFKSKGQKKKVFRYEDMNKDKWDLYKTAIDEAIKHNTQSISRQFRKRFILRN